MYAVGQAIGGTLAGILQAYVIGNEEKKSLCDCCADFEKEFACKWLTAGRLQ
jgi:hypothetical protein